MPSSCRTAGLATVLAAGALCAGALAATAVPLAAQLTSIAASQLCEHAMDGARFPDAKVRMQGMTASTDTPSAAFARGCLAMGDQQWDQASDHFERAVAASQTNAAYHFQLGQSYGARAQHANPFKQAILARKVKREFERAIELDPDLIDARVGLVTFYLVAPGILGGSEGRARAEAEEIRRRDPYRGGIAFAQVAGHLNDLQGATRELDALTRQYPDSTMPYVALERGYATRKLWPDAWATLDRLRKACPDAPVADYEVGRLAGESGEQLDRGAAALTRYLGATARPGDPPPAAARWRLGVVAERQGRKEDARTEYQTALRLDPTLTDAKDALKRVR